MTYARLLAAAVCAAALSACNNTTTGPSSTQPFSQLDLTPGTGAAAATGDTLTVDYTGWVYDPSKPDHKGLQFDSSLGRTPFVFTLGAGSVIQGWEQGLPGMKVGGVRQLVIPPSLGYGASRTNSIPPYATLVFDITLIDDAKPATSGSAGTSRR